MLLAHTGQEVYVPGAKRLARGVSQNCLVCKKAAPRPYQQKMGQLPAPRVTKVLPFVHTGVDFAGPFILRYGNPRKPDTCKAYLSIFVCLTTKLVHIEVVSSASTGAFTAALKRICCRAGKPSHIYSDNGSNFIGARNQLKELYQFLDSTEAKTAIQHCLLERRITWHHIPEEAPYFGGIWEASVKAAKHCLKRTIGVVKLSFEELATISCQAVACLNSRPYLAQDSHDPAGEMPLTRSHFLIGRPMEAYPEAPEPPDLTLSDRWLLCKSMAQQFWDLWQRQYLQSLQKAQKWHKTTPNVKKDDLVMVLDETSLQTHWLTGKVLQVYPGEDGLVRTAKVLVPIAIEPLSTSKKKATSSNIRIKKSVFKRPITKLAPLLSASPLILNEDLHPQSLHQGEDV